MLSSWEDSIICSGLVEKHSSGLNRICLEDRGLRWVTVSPLRLILLFRVPQGSVLGPRLFTLHTTPPSSMISGQAIPHHHYADGKKLCVSFASGDSAAALNGLQSCLATVQSWMWTNKLTLNPGKTEFLLIENDGSRANISLYFLLSFQCQI